MDSEPPMDVPGAVRAAAMVGEAVKALAREADELGVALDAWVMVRVAGEELTIRALRSSTRRKET